MFVIIRKALNSSSLSSHLPVQKSRGLALLWLLIGRLGQVRRLGRNASLVWLGFYSALLLSALLPAESKRSFLLNAKAVRQ